MEQHIRFCTTPEGVHLACSTVGHRPALVFPPGWIIHLELQWKNPPYLSFWEKVASARTIGQYGKHGGGLSDRHRTEFTMDKEVRDLKAGVDFLKLNHFDLLRGSQAGPTAITFAARHPQRVNKILLYGTYARGETIAKDEVKTSLISLVLAHWGLALRRLAIYFSLVPVLIRIWSRRGLNSSVRLRQLKLQLD